MDKTIVSGDKSVVVALGINKKDVFTDKFIDLVDETLAHYIIKSFQEEMSVQQTHDMFVAACKEFVDSAVEWICNNRGSYLTSSEHSAELLERITKIQSQVNEIANDDSESEESHE